MLTFWGLVVDTGWCRHIHHSQSQARSLLDIASFSPAPDCGSHELSSIPEELGQLKGTTQSFNDRSSWRRLISPRWYRSWADDIKHVPFQHRRIYQEATQPSTPRPLASPCNAQHRSPSLTDYLTRIPASLYTGRQNTPSKQKTRWRLLPDAIVSQLVIQHLVSSSTSSSRTSWNKASLPLHCSRPLSCHPSSTGSQYQLDFELPISLGFLSMSSLCCLDVRNPRLKEVDAKTIAWLT